MAYDETLAQRVRIALAEQEKVVEKKMFGGIAFMVRGHMTVGILKDELLVRVGPETHEKALAKPFARVMDFTGKPMKGFINVEAPGIDSAAKLKTWIRFGLDYTTGLPEKKPATGSGKKGKAKGSSPRPAKRAR